MAVNPFQGVLDLLAENFGTTAASYARSMNPLSSLIRIGDTLGMSGRAILSAYRAAGGAIATQRFYQLRQATLASVVSNEDLQALINGDLSVVRQLPGGREGVYRLDFILHNVNTLPNGALEYTTSSFTMLQKELDIGAANEAMGQIASNLSEAGEEYPQTIGFELQAVSQYTGQGT
jgi:hypothetical protein